MADKAKKRKQGHLVYSLIYLTYLMPSWLVIGVGKIFGRIGVVLKSRNTRVVEKNLSLCFPEMEAQQRSVIAKELRQHNAKMAKQVATAWLGGREKIEPLIQSVIGNELIEEIQAQSKPLIIAVPHIGNWEFFWHWLQLNYQAISMYTPAKYEKVDSMMLDARTRFGGKPYATDPKGIMGLLRALKKGGIMMILPDQVPKNDGGVFAPFFNHQAYTMTLVHKFIEKTGAELCFGTCICIEKGKFEVRIEMRDFDATQQTAEEFCQQMNLQLESIIRRNPAQYQWNYKRFKRQPDGSDIYSGC